MKYMLKTDGDSHWFVIPADKEDEWCEWCEKVEKYWKDVEDHWEDMPDDEVEPLQPDWADAVGGAPSHVTFDDYEIG